MAFVISEETLRIIFREGGIPVDQWGVPGTRTLSQLAKDFASGERELGWDAEHGWYQIVRLVRFIIVHPEKGTLFESHQIEPGGNRLERNQPPGGKMKTGEDPRLAAERERGEELPILKGKTLITLDVSRTFKSSKSCPGLLSLFEYHDFSIETSGDEIPDDYSVRDHDGKMLYFAWKK
ncbi:MAG: NUDIX domain-containing protein [Candidatus Pacebacteria bacterium]|nr:NUDIX domain-containing protein [Candidatus Paceibacterota bacterium]